MDAMSMEEVRMTSAPSIARSVVRGAATPMSPSTGSESDPLDIYEMPVSGVSEAPPLSDSGLLHDSSSRTSNSYAELPREILLQIFRYVLLSQQDLQACLLVCRRWCVCGVQVLWYRPSFYRLSTLFKLIHVMIQPEALFPYASYIRRLNFSLLAGELDDQLFGRMAACRRLERLTLSECTQVTDATLSRVLQNTPQLVAMDVSWVEQVTDATLYVIAQTCGRLQGINITGCRLVTSAGVQALAECCHMLRRIKLAYCAHMNSQALIALLQQCPILLEIDVAQCPQIDDTSVQWIWLRPNVVRELKLAYCTQITDGAFPTTSLHDTLLRASSQHPPTFHVCEHLRMLDLTGCAQITDEAVRAIVAHAPRLRNLSLAKCTNLTDESVYAIASLGRQLQHLHLAHMENITDPAVIHLAQHCTRLRYLDLACCVRLTDASVIALAANLPKLRRIGLVRVTSLSDTAIYGLVERHTNLERVHLSYCHNITVPAIFWLVLRLPRLMHLSLTGVPAFQRPRLQAMCRTPPKEFNHHQRQMFCVYSNRGIVELRRHLQMVFADPSLGMPYGTLPSEMNRAFQASWMRQQQQQQQPQGKYDEPAGTQDTEAD